MKLACGYIIKINILFSILILYNIFYFSNLSAENIDMSDLSYLNNKDKIIFKSKCTKDNKVIPSSQCLNFIGIKIYLVGYLKKEISKKELEALKKKSIQYLNLAIESGSRKALKNLAWVYSSSNSNISDLQKSSEIFKELKKENLRYKINNISKTNNIKKRKKYNLAKLELAILLIENLTVYYNAGQNTNFIYITEKQMKDAKNILKKVIIQSKASEDQIKNLRSKIRKKNEIVLSFLKEDLKHYSKKTKRDADEYLKRLKSLLIN